MAWSPSQRPCTRSSPSGGLRSRSRFSVQELSARGFWSRHGTVPDATTDPAAALSGPRWEALRQLVPAGMRPEQVADAVFAALRKDQFYVLTHPEGKEAIRTRMEDILQERNPTPLRNRRLKRAYP